MPELVSLAIMVAIAGGLYAAWKFYKLRVRQHLADHPHKPLFSTPTIIDYGPAYKPNGEINWQSDEIVRGYGAKMAMMREGFGEKHQCPKCGSRAWRVANQKKTTADVSDMIFCHACLDKGCHIAGTDKSELRLQMEAENFEVYPLADWDLYAVRVARAAKQQREAKEATYTGFETTFSLVAAWFRR